MEELEEIKQIKKRIDAIGKSFCEYDRFKKCLFDASQSLREAIFHLDSKIQEIKSRQEKDGN